MGNKEVDSDYEGRMRFDRVYPPVFAPPRFRARLEKTQFEATSPAGLMDVESVGHFGIDARQKVPGHHNLRVLKESRAVFPACEHDIQRETGSKGGAVDVSISHPAEG